MKNPPRLGFVADANLHKARIKKYTLIATDLLSLVAAFLLGWLISTGLRSQFLPHLLTPSLLPQNPQQATVFLLPAIMIVFLSWSRGHYTRFKPFWDEQRDLFKIVLYAITVDIVFLFVIKSQFSRMWLATSLGLILFLLPLSRVFAKKSMMRAEVWFTPTVVVGTGENALEAAQAIESDPMMGHKVIGLIDPTQTKRTSGRLAQLDGYPVFAMDKSPAEIHEKLGRPFVVIALDDSQEHKKHARSIAEWISECQNAIVVPPMRGLPLYGTEVAHIFRHETLLLRLQNNLSRRWPRTLKRSFDIVTASLLLIFLSPLFAYLIIKIRQDGGLAFFGHERIGRCGKIFMCYKFRSMVPNASKILEKLLTNDESARVEWEKDQKLKNDPRITKIGQFLRKTSLDELPQLWNVLKSEMSLVGPRPIVHAELDNNLRYPSTLSPVTAIGNIP